MYYARSRTDYYLVAVINQTDVNNIVFIITFNHDKKQYVVNAKACFQPNMIFRYKIWENTLKLILLIQAS